MTHSRRLLILAVCYWGSNYAETGIDCDASLGFNPKTLSCSVCDEMKEFSLSKDIQKACTGYGLESSII